MSHQTLAQEVTIDIGAPYGSLIDLGSEQFLVDDPRGMLSAKLAQAPLFPLLVKAHGPLGGIVEKTVASMAELFSLSFPAKIIEDKNSHPAVMAYLPKLCRNVRLTRWPDHTSPLFYATIDESTDRLNRQPVIQLLDQDMHAGNAETSNPGANDSFKKFDGQNVLLVQSIILTNDYEDSSIVDFQGINPLTGKPDNIHEGEGGFYANIHYAVLPYNKRILKMSRQTLLHYAQGKLQEIDSTEIPAALKTHGLLPGPFVSREGPYPLCEWGDTSHQAPLQRVDYKNLGIWDWDYPVSKASHVILLVWEGDEEDWLINQQLIDPTYLTDDIIGVFEVDRKKTLKPLILKNTSGDFSMTIVTGNIENFNVSSPLP